MRENPTLFNRRLNPVTCLCGQVPEDIFFAKGCDCGACENIEKHPEHETNCRFVLWAQRRNEFIRTHRLNPPMPRIVYNVKKEGNNA